MPITTARIRTPAFATAMGFALLTLILATPAIPTVTVRGDDLGNIKKTDKNGDREANVEQGVELINNGDKLADDGKTTEAVLKYKAAFEQLLPGMRKIRFKTEVGYDVTAREELGKFLIQEMDEEITAEEMHGNESAYKALGLIPMSMDLKGFLVKLYSEEIAAFYDPRTGKMHLIKEPKPKDEPKKKPGFFERLLGGGEKTFDKDNEKAVIAHEMTHALADQNYDLILLQKTADGDDDRALALTSLIEGEAMMTMIGAAGEDWKGETTSQMPAGYLEQVFGFMMRFMPMLGGKSLRDAPPLLSENLVFPYFRGVVFCARLVNEKGWDALGAAYKQPPLSSEQILHPEKYQKQPDPPQSVDLGQLNVGPGWKEVYRNVLGEMVLGVALGKFQGKVAAAGWDGDSYVVFEKKNDAAKTPDLGLVLSSTWDSDQDAGEFLRSYAQYQSQRFDLQRQAPAKNVLKVESAKDGKTYLVEQRGPNVIVIEGFSPEITAGLATQAFQAKHKEKTAAEPADPEGFAKFLKTRKTAKTPEKSSS